MIPATSSRTGSGGEVAVPRGQLILAVACVFALGLAAFLGSGAPLAAAAEPCPNEALRSGASASLPDCRAYEQVSPVDKNGGDVSAQGNQYPAWQSSLDGDRVAYSATHAFADSLTGAGLTDFYLASRHAGDWSTHALLPSEAPGLNLPFPLIEAFSPDLSTAVLHIGGDSQDDPPLVPGEPNPAEFKNLFLRDNATDSYRLLDLTPEGLAPADAEFGGASPDLSHVVFDSSAQLTPEAPANAINLYEWAGGTTSLLSLQPGNVPFLAGSRVSFRAISAGGSRVYFTDRNNSNEETLYLREDGERTVLVTPLGSEDSFQAASADGSVAYFTKGGDLYRYDATTEAATDLTSGGEVQGVVGASQDGSYLYFVAKGVLTGEEENAEGARAAAGQDNLYLFNAGAVTFITTISGGDCGDWQGCFPKVNSTARTTPDGTRLAFDSKADLTGYESAGYTEVYLYDASTRHLLCASCNPGGARPSGDSVIGPSFFAGDQLEVHGYRTRNLSEAGTRLFFNSDDAILPQDSNGRQDVYEWEATGIGSCEESSPAFSPSAAGCLYLISTGVGREDSEFADASASGNDVFFTTVQRLVPSDRDSASDLYDARSGGGFPTPPPPPPCQGDACQSPPGAPNDPTPSSSTFQGPGNGHSTRTSHRRTPKPHRHRAHGKRHRRRAASTTRRVGR